MTTYEIISATFLVSMATLCWAGYVRECRRIRRLNEELRIIEKRAKLRDELGEKITRRINRGLQSNLELMNQYYNEGTIPDEELNSLLEEENKEIEQMIEKYKNI